MIYVSSIFQSKLSLCIIVLTLLWALSDANDRLTAPSISQKSEPSAVAFDDTLELKAPAKLVSMLEQVFSKYAVKVETVESAVEDSAMTAEQQAEQSGILETVHIGDVSLELKAIATKLTGNNTVQEVILLVQNASTKESTIEVYGATDSIYGFSSVVINSTQVKLTRTLPSTEQQVILLSMYGK